MVQPLPPHLYRHWRNQSMAQPRPNTVLRFTAHNYFDKVIQTRTEPAQSILETMTKERGVAAYLMLLAAVSKENGSLQRARAGRPSAAAAAAAPR